MNNIAELLECIRELRMRIEKYSTSSLKEAQTRLVLINPMLKALGWDVGDPDQVDVEHGTVDGKAVDYALKIEGKVVLLVEAKSLSDPLTDVKAITQVVGYASNEGVDWCVLTNGSTYRIYRSTEKAAAPEKLLYEVCIEPTAMEGVTEDQIAHEMARLSRQAIENHVLDQFAEQVFTRIKVLKALEKLFSDPSPKLLGIVADAAGDGSFKNSQVKEAIKNLWAGWREASSSNRLRPSPRVSIAGDIKDAGVKVIPTDREQNSVETQKKVNQVKIRHPPVKSADGAILAASISLFARNHNPPLKYEGMRTAIDVLTACKSPTGDDYDFHYDVDYRRDGIYVERKPGRGYRTLQDEVDAMRARAGFQSR